MKITDVEAIVLRRHDPYGTSPTAPRTRCRPDPHGRGPVGIGEVDSAPEVAKAAIEAPKSHLTCAGSVSSCSGKILATLGRLWESSTVGRRTSAPRGGIHALSGIDIALGISAGRPSTSPWTASCGPVPTATGVRAHASTLTPWTRRPRPGVKRSDGVRRVHGGQAGLGWLRAVRSIPTSPSLEAARRAGGRPGHADVRHRPRRDAANGNPAGEAQRSDRALLGSRSRHAGDDLRGTVAVDAVDTRIACGEKSVTRWELSSSSTRGGWRSSAEIAHAGGLTETLGWRSSPGFVECPAYRMPSSRNPKSGDVAPPGLAARGAPSSSRADSPLRPGPRVPRFWIDSTAWSACPRDPDRHHADAQVLERYRVA